MIHDSNENGFTLIELLVATAIFGLVISGMYTVYLSTQKTTINQSELVDVQQNLRVTTDFITKDIKMAEALIPSGNTGIASGSGATTLNLVTASSFYAFARIGSDIEIAAGGGNNISFNITVPSSVDYFTAGDTIRIIRPQNGAQPYDPTTGNELVVDSVNRGGPTIIIDNFANSAAVQYKAGDIIARVGAGAPDPSTITWSLNAANELQRARDGGAAEVMAENISNLAFSYLLDDGSETAAPADTELDNIRAVRVTLTADTVQQLDRQTRQRSLSSITYLRN